MKIQYENLVIWQPCLFNFITSLMFGALAASSQSARGLFISYSLNPEIRATNYMPEN